MVNPAIPHSDSTFWPKTPKTAPKYLRQFQHVPNMPCFGHNLYSSKPPLLLYPPLPAIIDHRWAWPQWASSTGPGALAEGPVELPIEAMPHIQPPVTASQHQQTTMVCPKCTIHQLPLKEAPQQNDTTKNTKTTTINTSDPTSYTSTTT